MNSFRFSKRLRYTTPEGTRDLLLEECTVRRRVESQLTGLFQRYGFNEVMTPGLEYYHLFENGRHVLPPENMYKLTDTDGRLLVMRPDMTLPIARMVSTRLSGAPRPVRLYYAQDVYRLESGLSGVDHQQFQAGVELIGASGERADMEMLALAAQSLRLCLGKQEDGFRIEIGHAGFFNSLLSELRFKINTDEAFIAETREDIRHLVETKNYAALGDLLDTLPASEAADAIRRLPGLFGGVEVLAEAERYGRGGGARTALDYLSTIYKKLCAMGLGGKVIIDLGLIHRHEYYTGMVFRGYIEGSGDTVVSGGRYDTLLRQFGQDMPATGFGINVDSITRVLLRNGQVTPPPSPSVLIHAMPGSEAAAFIRMEKLTAKGTVCEISHCDTPEKAREYAASRGIGRVEIVG